MMSISSLRSHGYLRTILLLLVFANASAFGAAPHCYSGVCKSESVWQDKNAFNAMHAEMLAQCVPNHQH